MYQMGPGHQVDRVDLLDLVALADHHCRVCLAGRFGRPVLCSPAVLCHLGVPEAQRCQADPCCLCNLGLPALAACRCCGV
jgi:hypothetical protein